MVTKILYLPVLFDPGTEVARGACVAPRPRPRPLLVAGRPLAAVGWGAGSVGATGAVGAAGAAGAADLDRVE